MHADRRDYEIDPHTSHWSDATRLGFGALAALPLTLLVLAGSVGIADAVDPGHPALTDAAAMLLYAHFVTQFLVLAVYGHLLLEHDHLTRAGKLLWAASFLFIAPAAVIAFWLLHVAAEEHDHGEVRVTDVTRHETPHGS